MKISYSSKSIALILSPAEARALRKWLDYEIEDKRKPKPLKNVKTKLMVELGEI